MIIVYLFAVVSHRGLRSRIFDKRSKKYIYTKIDIQVSKLEHGLPI
jgi:hypothetical protein